MQVLTRRRNLSAIELLIGGAFIVVALFAWNQQSTVVDPDQLGPENWRYQLWQIGTLVIAFAGAPGFGPTVRASPHPNLGNGPARPLIFLNTYTDEIFGDHLGAVWAVLDGLSSPSLPSSGSRSLGRAATEAESWPPFRRSPASSCSSTTFSSTTRPSGAPLDPVMMLVALLWAVVGLSPDIGGPVGGD